MKTRITLDGKTFPCRLVNLSAVGAVVATSFPPVVGAPVELDLPGAGLTAATVVRVTSTYIALDFDAPIEAPDAVTGRRGWAAAAAGGGRLSATV